MAMFNRPFTLPPFGVGAPPWDAIAFPVLMWLTSRLLIGAAMLAIAPLLPVPNGGEAATLSWETFSRWDSRHYEHIVHRGYVFRDDGKGYNIAFFPLYPLLIRGLMQTGLSFELAGTLINTMAFLGALIVLYRWLAKRHGQSVARWSTAVLAWCPFSLFCSVVYTEGLFLLGSTAALSAFDRQQYGWAALWGAITTAIRPPGIALIPAFGLAAWQEKRGLGAYLAAIATGAGIALYMLYCGVTFGEPLAFLLTQRGWQSPQDFHGQAWVTLLMVVLFGPANEDERALVDPWYPLALVVLGAIALWLWRSRHRSSPARLTWSYGFLILLLWLVGGSPLINLVVVVGGVFLIGWFRRDLAPVAYFYGLISWGIILSTGRTTSAERYAYGVVTLAIALGLLLHRAPRWGYVVFPLFALLLTSLSVRFAQGLWAG